MICARTKHVAACASLSAPRSTMRQPAARRRSLHVSGAPVVGCSPTSVIIGRPSRPLTPTPVAAQSSAGERATSGAAAAAAAAPTAFGSASSSTLAGLSSTLSSSSPEGKANTPSSLLLSAATESSLFSSSAPSFAASHSFTALSATAGSSGATRVHCSAAAVSISLATALIHSLRGPAPSPASTASPLGNTRSPNSDMNHGQSSENGKPCCASDAPLSCPSSPPKRWRSANAVEVVTASRSTAKSVGKPVARPLHASSSSAKTKAIAFEGPSSVHVPVCAVDALGALTGASASSQCTLPPLSNTASSSPIANAVPCEGRERDAEE